MSRYSKVNWSEGLFLRQHHLQQADRYTEQLVENRTRFASPYPWGFSDLKIDTDLAQRNKFGLRHDPAARTDRRARGFRQA
jgi:type VI secretion system protein ImpJ